MESTIVFHRSFGSMCINETARDHHTHDSSQGEGAIKRLAVYAKVPFGRNCAFQQDGISSRLPELPSFILWGGA